MSAYIVVDAGRVVQILHADGADAAYAAQTEEGDLFIKVGGEMSLRAMPLVKRAEGDGA